MKKRTLSIMKKVGIAIVLLTSIFLVVVLTADAQVKSKSFQVALQLMLSNKTPIIEINQAAKQASNYTFLDAREPVEYDVSHIQYAKNVGYNNFEVSHLGNLPKTSPIVVYCSVGKTQRKHYQ